MCDISSFVNVKSKQTKIDIRDFEISLTSYVLQICLISTRLVTETALIISLKYLYK